MDRAIPAARSGRRALVVLVIALLVGSVLHRAPPASGQPSPQSSVSASPDPVVTPTAPATDGDPSPEPATDPTPGPSPNSDATPPSTSGPIPETAPSPESTVTSTADPDDPGASVPVLNEASVSTTGPDVEYLEVLGPPTADLSALTVLQVEGDAANPSVGQVVTTHPVGVTDEAGLWVGEYESVLGNGTLTLLLVDGWTGETRADGDLGDVVDSVAFHDGGSDDVVYSSTVLDEDLPGVSFTPGGASRIPDGIDTDSTVDWVANDFDLAGIAGFEGSLRGGEARNTPGQPNSTEPLPPGSTDGSWSQDHVWSWWIHPVASRADGVGWLGGVSGDGDVQVVRAVDGQGPSTIVLDRHQADDHNAPAVLARPGKPTFVAWTQHRRDNQVHYRLEDPDAPGTFGPRQTLFMPDRATYVQVVAAGGRLLMATRVGTKSWYLMESIDDGVTWSTPRPLYTDIGLGHSYLLMRADPEGKFVHLVMTKHPGQPDTDTTTAYLDPVAGTVHLPGGHDVGNIRTGAGLPLERRTTHLVLDVFDPWRTRVLDFAFRSGRPTLVYAVWSSEDPTRVRYRSATWDGQAWQRGELGEAGSWFNTRSRYPGGAVVVGDRIVTASEAGGTWQLDQWDPDGAWGFTRSTRLVTSDVATVRPTAVLGGEAVLAQELSTYAENFTGYVSRAVSVTPDPTPVPDLPSPVQPAGDTSWAMWSGPVSGVDGPTRWVGGVGHDGELRVSQYRDGHPTASVRLAATNDSREDAPAVLTTQDGSQVVAWAGGASGRLYVKREDPDRPGALGPTTTLRLPGTTRFSQLVRTSKHVVVATRVDRSSWYLAVSSDDGRTWGTPRRLVDGGAGPHHLLMSAGDDADRVRFSLASHRRPTNLGYGYLDVATGTVWAPGRRRLGNLETGSGLPLDVEELEVVLAPSSIWRTLPLALGERDGRPMLVYAVWPAGDLSRIRNRSAVWAGGAWHKTTLGPGWAAGSRSSTMGGAALIGDRIIASVAGGDGWSLQAYDPTSSTSYEPGPVLASDTEPLRLPSSDNNDGVVALRLPPEASELVVVSPP